MRTFLLQLFGLSIIVLVSGCSTWRCRGFVNSPVIPSERPKGEYRVGSIVFEELESLSAKDAKQYEHWIWLSRQSHLTRRSYEEDVSRAMGYTNVSSSAKIIELKVKPRVESFIGWKTVFWPLVCTAGVMPAHFTTDIPFLVEVKFADELKKSRPRDALVRIDVQRGLTLYDMDNPPPALGCAAECRDDGTIGSGSELREERLRDVFVNVLANAVLMEINSREGGKTREMGLQRTEFGYVQFLNSDVQAIDASPSDPSETASEGGKAEVVPEKPHSEQDSLKNSSPKLDAVPAPIGGNEKKVSQVKPVPKKESPKKEEKILSEEYQEKERKMRALLETGYLSKEEFEMELKKIKDKEESK